MDPYPIWIRSNVVEPDPDLNPDLTFNIFIAFRIKYYTYTLRTGDY
jgi:hypothetical protein